MNKQLLQLLCCPICKSDLNEIKNVLICRSCKQKYPIKDEIPCLLPPQLKETDAELKKTYEQTEVAKKFGIDPNCTGSVKYRKLLREKSLKLTMAHQGKLILDVGCGNGLLLEKLIKHFPNSDIIGLDISLQMIKEAKKKIPNGNFILGSVNALPIKSNSIDTTLCIDLLHHFSKNQVPALLDELFRITQPRGVLITYLIFSTFFGVWLSYGNKLLQLLSLKPKVSDTPLAGIYAHKVSQQFITNYMKQKNAQHKIFKVAPFLNWRLIVSRKTI